MKELITILKTYKQSFLKELDRLNEAQKQAVEQIEGPVLVIAGPGTGKTHILTARIGRILLETDTQAHNILCLTFTDAAVHAMRERLLEFIGPEAHRVHIYTFHSFCNRIIQDNLALFGRHDLESLSDLERVEIIRQIIEELEVNHPLKRGKADMYFYEEHLYDLFQRMKSEGWTVDFVLEKIEDYIADLPNRAEYIYKITRGKYKKGELKTAKYKDTVDRMRLLQSAVRLFPEYDKMLEKYRRYDYDDMILWVLRAFEENEALLRAYQEQYLYFLIDEYQDTNGAQNQVIHQLIDYWDNPNIFIVGDDDQSIFEFQGARLKNLSDFYYSYEQFLNLVVLKDNYRSSQHILNASRQVIRHNEKRLVNHLKELGIEKKLWAQHPIFSKAKLRPIVVEYPNRTHEETDIVQQLEAWQAQNFPLEEVAIIYARHRQARNIANLLEKKGIPYNTRRRVNVLDLPMIQNLRLFLEYLYEEYIRPHGGEHLLFQILHFDFLNFLPEDLAKFSVHQASVDYKNRLRWRDAIANAEFLQQLQLKNPQAFTDFSDLLHALLKDFSNRSVPVLLERLINRSGLLQHILKQANQLWLLQVLKTFFDFVKKEGDRNPRLNVKRLLEVLESMDANRLPIELIKVIHSENGVNLLTAHSAKGLEFQRVFLIDCVKDYWEARKQSGLHRFSFPDTLTFSGEEDAMEARRRLFYVAMTRAKEQLSLSYSRQSDEGKELQRAIFVDELVLDAQLKVQKKESNEKDLLHAQFLQLLETQQPKVPLPNKQTLDALLQDFALSVSSMNQYLKCPLSFYYENVLRVPTLNSEAASYGTAMHNALQRLFEKMFYSEEKAFMDVEAFIGIFNYEMRKQRSYFTKKGYKRRLAMGQQNLTAYYLKNIDDWHKNVRLEFTIKNVEMEGIPLTGTIDRLEFHKNNKAHIVDYKTGSLSNSKVRRPTKSNPYGGSYWRQLVFYKILYENYRNTPFQVVSGEISYLELDVRGDFIHKKIKYTPKDVAKVKELIKTTYNNIQQHQFFEGCGEKHCTWCNFVKNNIRVDSFADREIEELDD